MKTIAIRLDSGKSIGVGHLMRCMALAESLQREAEVSVIFICRDKIQLQTGFEVVYLDKDYQTDKSEYTVPSIDDEIEELRQIMDTRQIDCLIVDHYGAGAAYLGTDADYGTVPIQLLGGEYTLLRKEFTNLPKRILRDEIQDVYITSGGSDPLQFCKRVMEAMMRNIAEIRIHVIAGSGFEESYIAELTEHDVIIHKKANMLECMQKADLFISSAGSTLYELAVTGTPSISYILVDNQIRVAKRMWEEKCSMAGGDFEKFSSDKLIELYHQIADYKVRQRMSEKAQQTIYSDGAANAARQIISLISGEKGDMK